MRVNGHREGRQSEAEKHPTAGDETLLKEMGAFNEQLVKAGIMLAGEGPAPEQGRELNPDLRRAANLLMGGWSKVTRQLAGSAGRV